MRVDETQLVLGVLINRYKDWWSRGIVTVRGIHTLTVDIRYVYLRLSVEVEMHLHVLKLSHDEIY